MKKIFTFCLALMALSSMPAMAQDDDEIDNTIQIVDAQGNIIEDGAQLVRNTLEDAGVQYQISSGLYVNNTSDEGVYTNMEVNISRLDNGVISCCFPKNCIQNNVSFQSPAELLDGGVKNYSIQTEWIPGDNEETGEPLYGEAVAQFRIRMYAPKFAMGNQAAGDFTGYGPSFTITFINADPTGITSITKKVDEATVTAIYNIRGEQLSKMQKGLNIVRYADGSTKKIIK